MDRVDQLRTARRSYSVTWRDFIIGLENEPDCLFCFFEGEDSKYYGVRIDLLVTGHRRKNLNCDGKEGLFHILNLVKSNDEYRRVKTAFFVDKDFDEFIEIPSYPDLYVTPCYSIENFYVTPEAFSRVINDEFKLSSSEIEFDHVIKLYKERLNEFILATEELHAWIFIILKNSKKDDNYPCLNLSEIKIEKLVKISLNCVEKTYGIEELSRLFPSGTEITGENVRIVIDQHREYNRILFYRGKFLIEFFRKFLKLLAEDSNSKNPKIFSKKRTVSLTISKINFLSELSQHADTPDCLRKFLSSLESNNIGETLISSN